MTTLPLIFAISRGAMDDGPGIRTTVFFKGCPLACVWCHNPESVRPDRELFWDLRACINCKTCQRLCRYGATELVPELTLKRDSCQLCGACTEECPANSRRLVGREYPVGELVAILKTDADFYRRSGGGVTFSGGEPTLHGSYLAKILKSLQQAGIHTAIQTCGYFALDEFRTHLLPHLDLVYFDLKLIDAAAHRQFTGVDNELILANFAALAGELGARLRPRVPLVPGITATEENLAGIARYLQKFTSASCELLPYNPGGIGKRQQMGQALPAGLNGSFMAIEEEQELVAAFQRQLAAASISHD